MAADKSGKSRACLATGTLALCLLSLPVKVTPNISGLVSIEFSAALAKDGSGNSGSGSSGSGSGSGGSGSGSSGSGSGSDRSGSGSDHGGSGDDGGSDDSGSGNSGSSHRGPNGERVEIRGGSIEVIYPDGWREEVRNGRFELQDPAGRTVVKRAATSEDLIRMRSLAR